jgi:hypothetical protein
VRQKRANINLNRKRRSKMAGFWEQFILTTVMGVLAGLKKSPANIPQFKTVLEHIIIDSCALLGVEAPALP